jgi:hypothetical protein
MKRILLLLVIVGAVLQVGLSTPSNAAAGWCWPTCSTYGKLGPSTSTRNGCWYYAGEVCSGWSYFSLNGVAKTCYPYCQPDPYTPARILYGFENSSRIRGRLTYVADTHRIAPSDVGMGGYLRAQVNWWMNESGYPTDASEVHIAAIG